MNPAHGGWAMCLAFVGYRTNTTITTEKADMTMFKPGHTLLAAALMLAVAGAVHAETATSRATLTIDGKTITLPHARAWSWGEFNGIPSIQKVVFAEKPLDDVEYMSSGNVFDDGAYGVVLSFRPSIPYGADAANFQYDPPENFDLHGVGFNSSTPSNIEVEGVTATGYTFKNGVFTGKLAWKGELTGGFHDDAASGWKEPVLTGWTAEFSIKPEATE